MVAPINSLLLNQPGDNEPDWDPEDVIQPGDNDPDFDPGIDEDPGIGGIAPPIDDPNVIPEPIEDPTLNDIEPYKPPDAYTPSGNALVENRLTGLLDSGSKFIRSARHRGREEAQGRGLLNSSIAAGAAERSAIESAFPIASQDAGSFQEAGMTGYQGEIKGAHLKQGYDADIGLVQAKTKGSIDIVKEEALLRSALSKQEAGQTLTLLEQEALQRAQLSEQEAFQALTLSEQQAIQATALSKLEAGQALTLSEQEAVQSLDHAKYIEQMQQDGANLRSEAQLKFDALKLSSQEKENVTQVIQRIGDTYSEQIRIVNSDPNLSRNAKTKIIDSLQKVFIQNMESVYDIYGVGIVWETSPVGTVTPPDEDETVVTPPKTEPKITEDPWKPPLEPPWGKLNP